MSQLPPEPKAIRMELWEHLAELRSLMIRCLLALTAGTIATYNFSDKLVFFLEQPLLKILPPDRQHLYYTGVADKFVVYLKISLLCAVFITGPYLLYQAWGFVAPGLYRRERRFVGPFMVFGSITFTVGLAFAYWVVIPFGYKFLLDFGSPDDIAIITLGEYFDTTLKLMFAMGMIFELPVLLVLLGKFGIVSAPLLAAHRRHAILAIAVVAAIATPTPDAFTMGIVMIPLYLLYEISIFAVRLTAHKPS